MVANIQTMEPKKFQLTFMANIKKRSDKLIEIFLGLYFLVGLLLATYYDTWLIAIAVGGVVAADLLQKNCSLTALFTTMIQRCPRGFYGSVYLSNAWHVRNALFCICWLGIMITYQKWKAQIPVAVVVVVHHAILGYLQYQQFESDLPNTIYFTQLNYMLLKRS